MKTSLLALTLVVVPFLAARSATAEQTVKTAANETRAVVASTQQKAAAIRNQATAPVKAARDQAAAQVASARNQATTQLTSVGDSATSQVNGARAQVKDKLKSPFKLPKFDVPDLALAGKMRSASVDPKVTSPRTLTYKSRVSRLSRWISPLTLGLIGYVPFDTMNAGVVSQMNNLMAEERIAVDSMTADAFEKHLKEGKRWKQGGDGVFKIQINRYALDPVPTSISLLRPTVSLTARLFDEKGKLLWVGRGFTSSLEQGIKGATLEQYAANPDALREDFATAVQTATKRAAAQANAVPKASVKVLSAEAAAAR
jgi:hypothetical protein